MKSDRAFTLVELLGVACVVGLVMAVLLPTLSYGARGQSKKEQNGQQLRGVHCALVTYAQGNKTYYPGIQRNGKLEKDHSVAGVLQLLLDASFFPGDYIIHPDDAKTSWQRGEVRVDHYSYALLRIEDRPEQAEWRDTLNSEAIVASDRAVGSVDPGLVASLWNKAGDKHGGRWRGHVVYNDNAVRFEQSADGYTTRYGDGNPNRANDYLFADDGKSGNADMVYRGTDGHL